MFILTVNMNQPNNNYNLLGVATFIKEFMETNEISNSARDGLLDEVYDRDDVGISDSDSGTSIGSDENIMDMNKEELVTLVFGHILSLADESRKNQRAHLVVILGALGLSSKFLKRFLHAPAAAVAGAAVGGGGGNEAVVQGGDAEAVVGEGAEGAP